MRKLILLITLVLIAASCGNKDKAEDPAALAGNTAKINYEYLLKGDYESFVDGTYHKKPIRTAYRESLIENAKMFVGQQKNEHQGIKTVAVDSVHADSLSHDAEVFLGFHYGDGKREQVLVPMIEVEGIWYMK